SLIRFIELPMAPQAIGVWPPSSDCVMGPPPENGTTVKFNPRRSLSISIDSEGVVPAPGDATLCLPGSRLMRSTSSVIVFAGKLGLTSQELGDPPALVTGMKSFSTSNGILL